jgi:hypothetical protein
MAHPRFVCAVLVFCIVSVAISMHRPYAAFAAEYVGQHFLMPLEMQNGAASSAAKKPHSPGANAKTRWSELPSSRQSALAPLASVWDTMSEARKKRWLHIGEKFPHLPTVEQERLHRRMHKWVELTPEQRRKARGTYARTQLLNREQKAALWQEYRQLPEREKLQLHTDGSTKSRVVRLPRRSPDRNASAPPIQTVPEHLMHDSLRPKPARLHNFDNVGEHR